MRRLGPCERDRGLADGGRAKILRLARYTLLRFDRDRGAQRAGTYARKCLHSDSIDCVRFQLANGRQLVIIDHLRLPGGNWQIRLKSVIHFVALKQIYEICQIWVKMGDDGKRLQ